MAWVRVLLPGILIVGWLVLAAIGGQYISKLSDLSSTDLDSFLPSNAESSLANKQLVKFSGSDKAIPVVIVYDKHGEKLSDKDIARLGAVDDQLASVEGVKGTISQPVASEDGEAAITIVPLASDGDFKTIFPQLKQRLSDLDLPVSYKLTGPASYSYTLQNAFSGVDGRLLIVAVLAVFLILLAVYRSPFLPFIVLSSALTALATAVIVVYNLTEAGVIQMNVQVQGIFFILVIGAATDYSLLYIARYREELTLRKDTLKATFAALKSSYQAIIAAGATVTVGLLCLLVSDLESNRALGPVGGIGIVFSILATLTFLPCVLLLFRRVVFWPRIPKYVREKAELRYMDNHPVWARVGAFVQRHPRRIWIVSTIALLLVACVGVPQLRADGVPQSDVIMGGSESHDGQKIVDAHFPPGSGAPAYIIVNKNKLDGVIKILDADKGVSSVTIATSGAGAGAKPVGKTAEDMQRKLRAAAKRQPAQQIPPTLRGGGDIKVVDGNVLLQAILTDSSGSLTARDTITRLRDKVQKADDNAVIGGASAAQLDTNASSESDIRAIIPITLLAITIILMLLLRAIVAPLLLLLSTILSFGATMGASALLFNHIWHFPGSDPAVIIFGFVFLVALGIDYNIFLMTRVREETVKNGVQEGTIKGLIVTGGVITSAGIVLAATFASLSVIPMLFLGQIAFIVTFGVLLDTIVVRSLLVPAITLEVGRIAWWPSRLFHNKK